MYNKGAKDIYGKGQSLQQIVLRKLDGHMQNNETTPLSTLWPKINWTWIKDLNVKPGTKKNY